MGEKEKKKVCVILSGKVTNVLKIDVSTRHLYCYINLFHLLLFSKIKNIM